MNKCLRIGINVLVIGILLFAISHLQISNEASAAKPSESCERHYRNAADKIRTSEIWLDDKPSRPNERQIMKSTAYAQLSVAYSLLYQSCMNRKNR